MTRLIGVKAETFDAGSQVGIAIVLDDHGRRTRIGAIMPLGEVEEPGGSLLSLCAAARSARARQAYYPDPED